MKTRAFRYLLFLLGVPILLSAPGAHGQLPAGMKPFETTKVADNVYSFRSFFHRTFFVVTNDGVIVGDPISVKGAQMMNAEIKKLTDKPVKYVLYSHNHWDHATGAKVFKDQGAQIVSQARCMNYFNRVPNPNVIKPDVTFKDKYEVKLGGETVRVLYFGPSHSDCLSFIHLPKQRLLFVVDVVSGKSLPFRGMRDVDPVGSVRALKALEALEGYDKIMPGHGPPTLPRALIKMNREYLEDLNAAVQAAVKNRVPVDKAMKEIQLPKYKDWRGYKKYLPMNIDRVYDYFRRGI